MCALFPPPGAVLSPCVALLTPQSFQSQLKFLRLYPYSYLITLFPSKYFSVWREPVFPCVFCLFAPLGCRHHRAGISVPTRAVSRFLTETWPRRDARVKFVPSVFLPTVPVSDYQRPVGLCFGLRGRSKIITYICLLVSPQGGQTVYVVHHSIPSA